MTTTPQVRGEPTNFIFFEGFARLLRLTQASFRFSSITLGGGESFGTLELFVSGGRLAGRSWAFRSTSGACRCPNRTRRGCGCNDRRRDFRAEGILRCFLLGSLKVGLDLFSFSLLRQTVSARHTGRPTLSGLGGRRWGSRARRRTVRALHDES